MWACLKNFKLFITSPSKGLYFYLKEDEFRFLNRNKNQNELLLIMEKIFKFNYNSNKFNFQSINYLNNID